MKKQENLNSQDEWKKFTERKMNLYPRWWLVLNTEKVKNYEVGEMKTTNYVREIKEEKKLENNKQTNKQTKRKQLNDVIGKGEGRIER